MHPGVGNENLEEKLHYVKAGFKCERSRRPWKSEPQVGTTTPGEKKDADQNLGSTSPNKIGLKIHLEEKHKKGPEGIFPQD